MTLFFAGQGTTANALSWAFWILAKHPEMQTRLREEIEQVVGSRAPRIRRRPQACLRHGPAGDRGPKALSARMDYGARDASRHLQLGGNTVRQGHARPGEPMARPQGRPLVRRIRYWHSAGNDGLTSFAGTLPRFAYFPFGGGARSCIGENFAWTEMLLILATIVGKWRLSMTPEASSIVSPTRASASARTTPVRLTPEPRLAG